MPFLKTGVGAERACNSTVALQVSCNMHCMSFELCKSVAG